MGMSADHEIEPIIAMKKRNAKVWAAVIVYGFYRKDEHIQPQFDEYWATAIYHLTGALLWKKDQRCTSVEFRRMVAINMGGKNGRQW